MADTSAEARRYHRWQLTLSVAAFGLTAVNLLAWVWSGAAVALAAALGARFDSRAAVVALMVVAVGGSSTLLTFPLDVVRDFVLRRRAGLLAQRLPAWLADKAKALALGGMLGLGVFELVYALLPRSPSWWWCWSAALLAAASVLLAAVVPVWIVPLFYRLSPLQDPDTRRRLLDLARRARVGATDISVADFSRKGRTANAAVVGLGGTRRILVSDTLLSSFPPAEVEVVLAHELAHHARSHLAQGLLIQSGLILVVFALTHGALTLWTEPLGLAGPADPAGVPLLALLLSGLGVAVTPLGAAWSRRLEREADAAALELTRMPATFVAAMERLGQLNLAERKPHRLKELLFATHPSLEDRIAFARAAEERWAGAT